MQRGPAPADEQLSSRRGDARRARRRLICVLAGTRRRSASRLDRRGGGGTALQPAQSGKIARRRAQLNCRALAPARAALLRRRHAGGVPRGLRSAGARARLERVATSLSRKVSVSFSWIATRRARCSNSAAGSRRADVDHRPTAASSAPWSMGSRAGSALLSPLIIARRGSWQLGTCTSQSTSVTRSWSRGGAVMRRSTSPSWQQLHVGGASRCSPATVAFEPPPQHLFVRQRMSPAGVELVERAIRRSELASETHFAPAVSVRVPLLEDRRRWRRADAAAAVCSFTAAARLRLARSLRRARPASERKTARRRDPRRGGRSRRPVEAGTRCRIEERTSSPSRNRSIARWRSPSAHRAPRATRASDA